MKITHQIVADGGLRAESSPEHAAACEEIERSVRGEFEHELEQAGWIRRLILRARIKRKIRRRIERLAPKDACYLVSGVRRTESGAQSAAAPLGRAPDR